MFDNLKLLVFSGARGRKDGRLEKERKDREFAENALEKLSFLKEYGLNVELTLHQKSVVIWTDKDHGPDTTIFVQRVWYSKKNKRCLVTKPDGTEKICNEAQLANLITDLFNLEA